MKTPPLTFTKPNAAWVFHREDFDTTMDGACNLYFLIDAYSNFCFGQEVSMDIPPKASFLRILKEAHKKAGAWPGQVLISKKDPALNELTGICLELGVSIKSLPPQDLISFVKPISDSLHQFNRGDSRTLDHEFSTEEQEDLKAFIPETYGACPCGSDKKFKFCCQKIFRDITFAMCAAEEGKLEEALKYMKDAESKVGKTPEVLCRIAICWTFFDREKSREYMSKAFKLNPNHPRTNYILGIDHVALEKFEEAVTFYQRAIDHYPVEDKYHLNETYNNLGTALFKLNKFKEAKEAWEKALVLRPRDEIVIRNLFQYIYDNPKLSTELRKISPFIEKFLKN